MQEIYSQILARLSVMWRRRWWAVTVAWVVCLAGWVIVARVPDVYEASARLYVDTDTMLKKQMKGIATDSNILSELKIVQRTLLSRPNLEKVMRMTDLDLQAPTVFQVESIVENLRKSITINVQGPKLFSLRFQYSDPKVAKDVVQSLLTIFVESNLGAARKDIVVTQKFINQQAKEHERLLTEAEERLAKFKRENVGFLPGEANYSSRLEKAHADLATTRARHDDMLSKLMALRKQLAEVPRFLETTQAPQVVIGRDDSDKPSELEVRVADMERQVDNLLLKYTERHPDVVALNRRLEVLRAQLDIELGRAKAPRAQMEPVRNTVSNPVYEGLKLSLVQVEAEIAILDSRIRTQIAEVNRLAKLSERVPEVEAELAKLNRGYAVIQRNYNELIERREAARIAQDLEASSGQIQFKVVDPPKVPVKPSGPNRLVYLSLVLVVGVGAGVGLALLLVQIDSSIPNLMRLRENFDLPILGSVSAVFSPAQRRRQALEMAGFGLFGCGLVGAFGGLVAIELLGPLGI